MNFLALKQAVDRLKPGAPLDKFIGEVVFPNFKNLEPGTRIKFDYPITALVGANGSGKSSVLHAMWGMPRGYSTSRFWFSTALDPIEDGGQFGIPRYFYQHWQAGLKRFVETRKVRGNKRDGYWEPSRALKSDGMAPMPVMTTAEAPFRTAQRWNPVERKVIYMNFKCEFSGFDRFFYFPLRGERQEDRQARFIRNARRLNSVVDRELQSYSPGGHQSVFENRKLTDRELELVGYILGRPYSAARFVQHRLYAGIEAPSVIFKRDTLSYSEAFAGSGELAIVRAVIEILKADKNALVLLDEPETSLHPAAQERFITFLFDQIKEKHLQVVLSTHSPTIVEMLPTEAIRVLDSAPSGRFRLVEVSHPCVAFNRLGHRPTKIILVAEDALLAELLRLALSSFDEGERSLFEVFVPPSGASYILQSAIPGWIIENRQLYVILDGDQKPIEELKDPDTVSESDWWQEKEKIDKYYNKPLDFSLRVAPKNWWKIYSKWVRARVKYLSAICPERVLLDKLVGSEVGAKLGPSNAAAKTSLVAELEKKGHRTTADAIVSSASFILESDRPSNEHIENLKGVISSILLDTAAARQS